MFKRRLKKQPIEADAKQAPSFKQLALRGSMLTVASNVSSQALRLGGNLILTRLLFPDAFGLMSLVQVFIQGLHMFSDVGIAPSIIQNERDDPAFLNTAWTLQVFRGFMLWICACLVAWPAVLFYGEPMLMQLLPVVGITALIEGLNSTKLATAERHLMLSRLTFLELGSYVLSLTAIVVWAWMYRSVWALVGGGIVGALAKMILSHIIFEGEKNRFHWDSESFRALHRFGRWIFFSTALTFLAGQSDRLILGRLLDVRFLGIYTVALTLSRAVSSIISQLGSRVLFPSYTKLIRERPERLYFILRQSRLIMIALSWGVSLFFIVFGPNLIGLLYDKRYTDAGWMLQLFSLGSLVGILGGTYDNVLLAKGKTFAITALLVVQIGVQVPAMFLGAHWGGQQGVIFGLVCGEWILYPSRAICLARFSLWQPEVDLPLLALASVVAAIVLLN